MNILKFAAVIFVVLTAGLMFYACSYPPELKYQNFLVDMDLMTRFDICFEKTDEGDTSFYNREELRVLKEDIASFGGDYDVAAKANADLTQAADALLACIDYTIEGQADAAAEMLEAARGYYEDARTLIRLSRPPEQEHV